MSFHEINREWLSLHVAESKSEAEVDFEYLRKYYEFKGLGGCCPLSGRMCSSECLLFEGPFMVPDNEQQGGFEIIRAYCANPAFVSDGRPLDGECADFEDMKLFVEEYVLGDIYQQFLESDVLVLCGPGEVWSSFGFIFESFISWARHKNWMVDTNRLSRRYLALALKRVYGMDKVKVKVGGISNYSCRVVQKGLIDSPTK